MLSVINFYKRTFLSIIKSEFSFDSSKAQEFNLKTDEQKSQFLKVKENANDVINYIQSLNKNNDGMIVDKFGDIKNDVDSFDDSKFLVHICKLVGLDRYRLVKGIGIDEITEKIQEFANLRSEVIKDSKKDSANLKLDVNTQSNDGKSKKAIKPKVIEDIDDETEEPEFKKLNTKEIVSKSESSFLGLDMFSVDSEAKDYLDDLQLKQLLHNDVDKLQQIGREIYDTFPKDDIDSNTKNLIFKDYIVGSNYSAMYDVLKKYGYEIPFLGLSNKEACNIYTAILSYVKNQKEVIPKLDPKEKLKLLISSGDGFLNTSMDSLAVGEVQLFYQTISGLTSDGIDALAKNLGYSTSKDLFSGMERNFFSTREAFQNNLKSKLATMSPAEIVVNNGSAKKGKELFDKSEKMQEEIHKDVDLWFSKVENIKNYKFKNDDEKATFIQQIKNKLTPKNLGIGVFNDQKTGKTSVGGGFGYSFNIQDLTFGILDSFSVGISKNGVGFVISKELLSLFDVHIGKIRPSLVLALANGIPMASFNFPIPNITGEKDYKQGSLSEQTMPTQVNTSIGAFVSPGAVGGSVSASFDSENTASGIEKMTNAYEGILNSAKNDILSEKTFEQSVLSKGKTNNYDKQAYQTMVNMFKLETSELSGSVQKEKYMKELFIPKFVKSYKEALYKNKDMDFDINSVTIGAIVTPGAVIPYLGIGGELKYLTVEEINRDLDSQRKITSKEIDIKKVQLETVDYQNKKVLRIPESFTDIGTGISRKYKISSSLENSQVKKENGFIYIGGDISSRDVKIDEYTDSKGPTRTIVIGEGIKDEDKDSDKFGMYLQTEINGEITEGIKVEKTQPIKSDLKSLDMNEEKGIDSIISTLNLTISKDSMKKVDGMMKLQSMIYDYKKLGTPDLDKVYGQYLKVISSKVFEKYAKTKGMDNSSVNSLIISSKSDSVNSTQKEFIIQSVSSNLMERGGLDQQQDGSYSIESGKTIKSYNGKSRDKFFDKVMSKELPLISSDISNARNEWFNKFGDKNSYNGVYVNDGSVGLSATRLGDKSKKSRDGLTPYTGAYNMAGEGNSPYLVEMKGLESKDIRSLLEKLPNSTLENYKKVLESNGIKLKNLEEVRYFIVNGGDKNKGISITPEVFFGKNAECLNDCIVFKLNLNIDGKDKPFMIGSTGAGSVGNVETGSFGFAVGGAVKVSTEKDRGEKEAGDKEKGDKEKGDKEKGDKEKGDKENGEKEAGDKEKGDKENGEKEAGDKEKGDKENGEKEAGDKEKGDKENGEKEKGDKENGDKENGDKENGDKEQGEKESGEKEAGDKEQGEKESGEKEAGDKEQGEKESGEKEAGDKEQGEKESGEKELGDKEKGDKENGEKEAGDKEQGDKENGEKENGEKEAGDKEPADKELGDEGGSDPTIDQGGTGGGIEPSTPPNYSDGEI